MPRQTISTLSVQCLFCNKKVEIMSSNDLNLKRSSYFVHILRVQIEKAGMIILGPASFSCRITEQASNEHRTNKDF